MLTITIGAPVKGDDFYDREGLVDQVWAAVAAGESVLLAAPRRVGKTSVMLRLRDRPREGYDRRVWYLDTEYYDGPEDVVAGLAIEAAATLGRRGRAFKRLREVASRVEEAGAVSVRLKLREQLRGDWKAEGRQLLGELTSQGRPCLLLIDELSVLLQKLARTGDGSSGALELLRWLRGMRQELGGAVGMVLGSSQGIGRAARRLGASATLADLRQVEVGVFDATVARGFARSLLLSEGWSPSDGTLEALLQQVGDCIPNFVQIMARALTDEARSRAVQPTPELVRSCYEQRVMGPEFRQQFDSYHERLDLYYSPDEARAARRLLGELSRHDHGMAYAALYAVYGREMRRRANQEEFDFLLAGLEEDFYVRVTQRDGARWVEFQNKWLRDWWRRFHGRP